MSRSPRQGPWEQHPWAAQKEQELFLSVPAHLHTSEAVSPCPQHVLVCQKDVFTWSCSQGHRGDTAALPWEALMHRDTQLFPWLSSSWALWDITPATGSATGFRGNVAYGFQGEKGTKIHCKLMFYWSIYTKHVVKVKKPSTSIIQNIVAVQDSINAAFIQIPSETVGT